MKGRAVITGADGGMGSEITKAVAQAGYEVIMFVPAWRPERSAGIT